MRVEVIYKDKYYLGELVKSVSIEESLDEIATRATVVLEYTDDYPQDISLGGDIRISGTIYGETGMKPILHNAVLWEIESNWQTHKELTFIIYDKCIYLKSEDEYLWREGYTATKRIQRYLQDLKLKISELEDTKIKLPKAVYRAQSIFSMVKEDLKATVSKGGEMYRVFMTAGGVVLRKIGSNKEIFEFSTEESVFNISQKRTIENVVTRVKILGSAIDDMKSPVIKVIDGDIQKYGIIQKIFQDENIENPQEAIEKGKALIQDKEETFTFTTVCIPQIRAGDLIKLNTMELIVYQVRHELGENGKTTISAGKREYIKSVYYT